MNRDLIIVSELFYPDKTSTAYIMTKIADKLYNSADLTVISGDHYYNGGQFDNDIQNKPYNIIRIKSGNLDKNKIISRAYKLALTSWRLFRKLSSTVKENSEVIIVTNPAPLLLLAAILKRFKKYKLNIIVQDVFPENAKAAGIISSKSLLYKILLKIWENSYSKADRLIVCGRDMKDVFLHKLSLYRKPPEIDVIENWADKNTDVLEDNIDLESDINILFAGNIGRCQGIESFLKIYEEANTDKLCLNFRGDGATVPFINKFISTHPDVNVSYGGKYTRDEQFNILKNCDIALVTLADDMFGLGVPSKSYNIMAAGKPILFIGDEKSEIAMVIKEHGIGYCFDPKDKNGIINWLTSINLSKRHEFQLKGKKAKQLAETFFSEETILNKYSELFSGN